MTKDPAGWSDGPNGYISALNNTVSLSDAYGLLTFEECVKAETRKCYDRYQTRLILCQRLLSEVRSLSVRASDAIQKHAERDSDMRKGLDGIDWFGVATTLPTPKWTVLGAVNESGDGTIGPKAQRLQNAAEAMRDAYHRCTRRANDAFRECRDRAWKFCGCYYPSVP